MRDVLIVLGMCVAAITLGLALYLYGPDEFRNVIDVRETGSEASAVTAEGENKVSFSVLAEGANAAKVSERKNYAAYQEEDFVRLWTMAYGEDAPAVPAVDFDSYYVIGVFAGQKASGGYGIRVEGITDAATLRNVAITLTRPGEGCMTTQALTSPFQIIVVPFSDRELSRTDRDIAEPCQ